MSGLGFVGIAARGRKRGGIHGRHGALARGLKRKGSKLDHEKFPEVFTVPLATTIARVREGKITDAKAIANFYFTAFTL
jgi:hypothetical protein